jgi:hypothetical protein
MSIKNRQLKNYLLFPQIQFRLLAGALVATLLSIGGAFYSVYSSFNKLESIGHGLKFPSDSGYFKLLGAQQEIIFSNIIIASLIGILCTIMVVMVVSHRALGPIYRIKVFFQNYDKNSNETIQFRDNDYFKKLEEDINKALK